MTFSKFLDARLGTHVDWDHNDSYQCVDLFRFYCNDVLNIAQPAPLGENGGAHKFWANYEGDPNLHNNFQKIGNTPEGVPQYGDVMVWNSLVGGGYGHIAIVIEADVNNFTSLDQNWPEHSPVAKVPHKNYTHVLGWFRPHNQAAIGEP